MFIVNLEKINLRKEIFLKVIKSENLWIFSALFKSNQIEKFLPLSFRLSLRSGLWLLRSRFVLASSSSRILRFLGGLSYLSRCLRSGLRLLLRSRSLSLGDRERLWLLTGERLRDLSDGILSKNITDTKNKILLNYNRLADSVHAKLHKNLRKWQFCFDAEMFSLWNMSSLSMRIFSLCEKATFDFAGKRLK
jgi:hypothetical protein